MSYKLDGKDIVISGFEQGIAESPYQGIADIRNANISSTPGEVAVNFSTTAISYPIITTGSVTSANAGTHYLTYTGATGGIENGMAIYFSAQSGLNVTADSLTPYWIFNLNGAGAGTFQITTNYFTGSPSAVAVTNGTGTFSPFVVKQPQYFTKDNLNDYWMVDIAGHVWFNAYTTDTNFYWTYTGNKAPAGYTNGNGIGFYLGSNGSSGTTSQVGYIFVFHNSSIDFTNSASGSLGWTYQWNPVNGSTGVYNATPTAVLKAPLSISYSHEVNTPPDAKLYFCDFNWVAKLYQTSPTTIFVPTDTTTYTFTETQILQNNDYANCLTYLGTNLLIGGIQNIVYVWNPALFQVQFPILLPENNVVKMVTVNSNTYIFAGNRGRIYVTNGTNANLYKKIPDNISGVLEPYFNWRGAAFQKNRLYFGFSVTKNNGTDLTSLYKGLWTIDTDTNSLACSNQLSGTNVYANAIIAINNIQAGIIPSLSVVVGGSGLYVGWSNTGNSSTGVDVTSSTPYSNLETTINTDMIPVGTYLRPFTPAQIEWKTSYPIGVNNSAETIQIGYRTALNQNFVTIGSTTVTGSTMVGTTTGTSTVATTSGTGTAPVAVSDYYQTNFEKAQWVQFQVSMSASASSPTYCRLTELRIREFQPQ